MSMFFLFGQGHLGTYTWHYHDKADQFCFSWRKDALLVAESWMCSVVSTQPALRGRAARLIAYLHLVPKHTNVWSYTTVLHRRSWHSP